MRTLIVLAGVEKTYRTGQVEYRALRGVDLSIAEGDMVAVVGPSGSGTSTILNMITGIDRPTAGSVTFDGARIDQLSEEQLAVWRGAKRRRRPPARRGATTSKTSRSTPAAGRSSTSAPGTRSGPPRESPIVNRRGIVRSRDRPVPTAAV